MIVEWQRSLATILRNNDLVVREWIAVMLKWCGDNCARRSKPVYTERRYETQYVKSN